MLHLFSQVLHFFSQVLQELWQPQPPPLHAATIEPRKPSPTTSAMTFVIRMGTDPPRTAGRPAS